MNIPAIGVVRGLFDVFVPGTFLLLNLILVVYLLPFADQDTKRFIEELASNSGTIFVLALCFGYLIGVLLRMLRTEFPDRCSAALLRRFHSRARKKNGDFQLWAIEEFPYIGWIGEVCEKFLPPEALQFYKTAWAPRKRKGQNRQFFNYCKIMVNSVDERAATEFNAAEALSRYTAAMFFTLVLASLLVAITTTLHYFYFHIVSAGLIALLVVYLVAIAVILAYLRFLRVKEVEIVFAACFKNKSIFEEKIPVPSERAAPKTLLDWLRELLCPKTPDS